MSAVFRIILAPITWAGGAVKTAFSPFTWMGGSGRRISTWMGQPATAFVVRRIAMVLAVTALLAFWLLAEFTQVEQAPIIELNVELAMWQIGSKLVRPIS